MKRRLLIRALSALFVIFIATAELSCGDSLNGDNAAANSPSGSSSTQPLPSGGTTTPPSPCDFNRFGYLDVPNGDWNWANYEQLFDGTYTHLLLAVMWPQADGSILNVDSMIDFNSALIAKAKAAGSKVLGSVGASVTPFSTYLTIANSFSLREKFIAKILSTIKEKGLDGIDLNFEGQYEGITKTQLDAVNNLAYLIATAVKDADANNIVTVTLVASYFLPLGFDCNFINSDKVDFAHHMSYNFAYGTTKGANGPWRAPGEEIWIYGATSPIERSVYGALKYLTDKGCDPKKLTGGIPFFSAQLNLWNEIRDKADWASIPMQTDYLEKLEKAETPYNWMNDAESVKAKITEYKKFGLGGVMVWQVGQEGTTGDLSRALYEASTK